MADSSPDAGSGGTGATAAGRGGVGGLSSSTGGGPGGAAGTSAAGRGGAGNGAGGAPGGGSTGQAGGAGAGGSAGGAGGSAADCWSPLPDDPAVLAAALGQIEAQLVANGRTDAHFDALFGDATGDVLANADAVQASAVEAVAADVGFALPAGPPGDLLDPTECGVTLVALQGDAGQAWETATFIAMMSLQTAIMTGDGSDGSFLPVENDASYGNVTTHTSVTPSLTLGRSKSHVSVLVLVTKSITATDGQGQALGSTDESATAVADVDFCPDASGVSPGSLSFTGDGTVTTGAGGGAASYAYHVESKASFEIHVDDAAETSSIDFGSTMKYTATASPSIDVEGSFTGTTTDLGHPGSTSGTIQHSRADGPQADIDSMDRAIAAQSIYASILAASAAKRKWQGGACVVVNVDPTSSSVDPNAQVRVTATPHHVFEDADLAAPVVGMLSGPASLSPAGQPVPAPAGFDYLAGADPGDMGNLTFKSTSKRGIGTGAVTFTVQGCSEAKAKTTGCVFAGQVKSGGFIGQDSYVVTVDATLTSSMVVESYMAGPTLINKGILFAPSGTMTLNLPDLSSGCSFTTSTFAVTPDNTQGAFVIGLDPPVVTASLTTTLPGLGTSIVCIDSTGSGQSDPITQVGWLLIRPATYVSGDIAGSDATDASTWNLKTVK